MRRILAGLATSAILALVSDARADEPDRCATAAEAAQAARAAGKLRAAREQVISCARESCPRVIRSDCARWLTEIDAELPTIVVRASDGGGADLSEIAVYVDGTKVADRVDGRPFAIDAGEHLLKFEKRGGTAVTQRVVVRSGERARIVSVAFEGGEPTKRASTVGPLVLGGLALGLVGGGGVLWAVGRGEHSDLESSCAPAGTCATGDIDAARTKLIVGDIVALAGVLALAGAVYWYVTSRSPSAPAWTTAFLTF